MEHILRRELTINERLTDPQLATHEAEAQQLAEEILRGMASWRADAASEGFSGLFGRSLSMAHVHVMFKLHEHDRMRMSELASALDISVANATGIVTRMEERRLVERSRDPDDRRAVNVTLTEEGRQLLENMDRRRREFFTLLMGRLSVDELTQLRNGMRAMFRAAGEMMASHRADPTETEKG